MVSEPHARLAVKLSKDLSFLIRIHKTKQRGTGLSHSSRLAYYIEVSQVNSHQPEKVEAGERAQQLDWTCCSRWRVGTFSLVMSVKCRVSVTFPIRTPAIPFEKDDDPRITKIDTRSSARRANDVRLTLSV